MPKGVIVACDVSDSNTLLDVVKATSSVRGVAGYKLGFQLSLRCSLPFLVESIRREAPSAQIIYDHQKAGNDIPDMGVRFAEACKAAGVDSVILFPLAGPVTQEAWTKACQDAGLKVIVGGNMTHKKFVTTDGGYVDWASQIASISWLRQWE